MHQQGLYPSQTKVAKLVRSSGGVRWLPEFKDAYQAAIAELNAQLAEGYDIAAGASHQSAL
ncbi:MAG: hypothetical protein DLM69_08650 [Candidatus Chloroheliales bacterium]|nr:MAG: hypothetical protein DLM69_08650 [Chloroflexota bacterium]